MNQSPDVHFLVAGATLRANPPGVRIYAELEQPGGVLPDSAIAWLTLHATADGSRIGGVFVRATQEAITNETAEIACALYWSWWRAQEAGPDRPGPKYSIFAEPTEQAASQPPPAAEHHIDPAGKVAGSTRPPMSPAELAEEARYRADYAARKGAAG